MQLNLVIAGLGTEGCDVEVKPGNASCKFRPIYGNGKRGETGQHSSTDGRGSLELRDVELRGADRTIIGRDHSPRNQPSCQDVLPGFPTPEQTRGEHGCQGAFCACFIVLPELSLKAGQGRPISHAKVIKPDFPCGTITSTSQGQCGS